MSEEMQEQARKWLKTKQGRKFSKYWGGEVDTCTGWSGGIGMIGWVAMVLEFGEDIDSLKANKMIRRVDDASAILVNAHILGFDFAA